MKNDHLALAGPAFGGIGVAPGLGLSSAGSSTPIVFGTTMAVYAAVAAALFAGIRNKRADPSRV